MPELAYVISDTHLGAGPKDLLEDFDQDAKFAEFVGGIRDGGATLFLNGDFIDFPQIPPFDVPPPMELLWGEAASTQKLQAALAGHPDCVGGLKQFLHHGGRLSVLVGNHDLDFAFEGVQDRFREALGGATHEQVRFKVGGGERFHGVWIEHGHEFAPENCPRDPRDFIHEYEGTRYLERVWGTDFVLHFLNELEKQHPFADNVKPVLSVVWQGLKHRWIGGRELVRMLAFLKRRGLPDLFEKSVKPRKDIELDATALSRSFADPEWRDVVAERLEEPAFRIEMNSEISALVARDRVGLVVGDPVETGDDPALVPNAKDGGREKRGLGISGRERRAADDRLARAGVTAVVFGHTHDLIDGNQLDGGWRGRLFNSGTWLPHLDLRSEDVRAKIEKHGLTLEMLSDPTLYRVDRTIVKIVADDPHAAIVHLGTAE
jgi:UDP-2,3-diacylglucosamine pyrophosphatase LpxH